MTTIACPVVATAPPMTAALLAYPNPSSGFLRITTALPVLLYAADGKILGVPRTVSSNVTLLNLSALASEIYLFRTDAQAAQSIVLE